MLCFSTSFSSACTKFCVFPVPFLFPSSVLVPFPVPFPVPFADSLCFSKESTLHFFLKKKTKKRKWKNTAFSITPGKGNWKNTTFSIMPKKGSWKSTEIMPKEGSWKSTAVAITSKERKWKKAGTEPAKRA